MSSIKKLYAAYRTAMLLGVAIGGGLVFYVIVVEVFKSYQQPEDPFADRSQYDLLRLIFYCVSFAQFVVIGFVRGAVLRSKSHESVDTLIEKLVRANIITLALCELPALFGLVLFFIGGFYTDFYILLGVSMLMLFFYFPKYNRWKEWIRKKAGHYWDEHSPE